MIGNRFHTTSWHHLIIVAAFEVKTNNVQHNTKSLLIGNETIFRI